MYRLYPFDFDYLTRPGKSVVERFSLIKAEDYGIIYRWAIEDVDVKFHAVSHYPNGIYKEFTASAVILKDTVGQMDGSLLAEAFDYANDVVPNCPIRIEFILLVQGCAPLKWILQIKGD